MLEKAGSMFDNMEAMMDRIKKKVYAERMERFREKNLEILAQMTDFVEQAEEQERDKAAAQAVSYTHLTLPTTSNV